MDIPARGHHSLRYRWRQWTCYHESHEGTSTYQVSSSRPTASYRDGAEGVVIHVFSVFWRSWFPLSTSSGIKSTLKQLRIRGSNLYHLTSSRTLPCKDAISTMYVCLSRLNVGIQLVKWIPDSLDPVRSTSCEPRKRSWWIHRRDWPDVESEIILKNVRKAMKPSSRVIIRTLSVDMKIFSCFSDVRPDDTVLRDAVHTHETSSNEGTVQLDIAPEPLLPNYGVARVRTYELDMTMMNLLNAQARTLPEFIELGWVEFIWSEF